MAENKKTEGETDPETTDPENNEKDPKEEVVGFDSLTKAEQKQLIDLLDRVRAAQ